MRGCENSHRPSFFFGLPENSQRRAGLNLLPDPRGVEPQRADEVIAAIEQGRDKRPLASFAAIVLGDHSPDRLQLAFDQVDWRLNLCQVEDVPRESPENIFDGSQIKLLQKRGPGRARLRRENATATAAG